MERRLDDRLFIGFGKKTSPDEESAAEKSLLPMPLCERIAYERAVKKGLDELQSKASDSCGIDFVSLYNYATKDWEK